MKPSVRSRWWVPAGALLALLVAVPLPAQPRGAAAAVVVYAEGTEFAVVDSRGTAVRVDPLEPVGLELVEGDTLVTEHGTFLELQLVPSANVVKVAENTNFTIERRGSDRGGTFTVVYGKVRARVRSLAATEVFRIRGGSALAGVRGTDFGVSVEVPREAGAETAKASAPADSAGLAETEVYCFEGEVEVTVAPPAPAAAGGAGRPAARTILVRAEESLSIGPSAEATADLRVEKLPESVRIYWKQYDFRAEPAAAPAASEPAKKVDTATRAEPSEPKPALGEQRGTSEAAAAKEAEVRATLVEKMTTQRKAFSTASVALFAAGGLLCAAGGLDALLPSVSLLGDNGYNFLGVGAVLILGGVFSTVQVDKVGKALKALQGGRGAQ